MHPSSLSGRHVRYDVVAGQGAFFVRKIHLVDGSVDASDITRFRFFEVAAAYAAAYAALDRYLAVLAAHSDASELFDEWRRLDDIYEDLSTLHRDRPRPAVSTEEAHRPELKRHPLH